LFKEASKLRREMVASAEKLHRVYGLMYAKARRNPAEDATPNYVAISNAGRRFAGSVVQGAKRTEAVDRALFNTKKNAREAQERKEIQERREADSSRRAAKAQTTRDVYGLFESSDTEAVIDSLLARSTVSADLNDLYGDD